MINTTDVYFAQVQSDNTISKVLKISAAASLDSSNSFLPSVGEQKCADLSISSSYDETAVVYHSWNYHLYPKDGTLVGGGVTYTWDSGTSKWSDGTDLYSWDNTNHEWTTT